MRLGLSLTTLLTTPYTLEPASQIPRVTRRPGLEFTNLLTAAIPGRILRQIRVFPLAQALIALARLGMAVFASHPRIAARPSMAVPSPLSSLIQPTRAFCTFHPIAACAASAQWPEALSRSLPVFRPTEYGNPQTAGPISHC